MFVAAEEAARRKAEAEANLRAAMGMEKRVRAIEKQSKRVERKLIC